MIGRLSGWLRRLLRHGTGGEPSAEEDSDDEPTAFSLLDASVNYSHGQSDGKAVRELQRANERADELADAHESDR